MAEDDNTKEILEKLLSELYGEAAREDAKNAHLSGGSYLIAADKQYLGKITNNQYDNESILNNYGPYGSPYSNTSIFNEYSAYGGVYGQYSPRNPYCSTPPKLFINERELGAVSVNEYVPNRIPLDAFLYTLRNDIASLLRGQIIKDEVQARAQTGDTFIRAADGTFLGSLNPNQFDVSSIFNKYGPHGSKYNQTCIFNKYSNYGGQYSALSPYNPRTRTPPQIFQGSKTIGYLTVNKALRPAIDPETIMEWAKQNVRKRIV